MNATRPPDDAPTIAYFCMEMALDPAMPTYSGGLGVLAADPLRAAADAGVPIVGVSLVHRKGYPRQHLDAQGNQIEGPAEWSPERLLEPVEQRVRVTIEGRPVQVRAWRYRVRGTGGRAVPVYLLDTALAENSPWDSTLTDHLYGGDERYRLCQEVVLGLGGVALLRALGHQGLDVYHLNEGHCALVPLALLAEQTPAPLARPGAAAVGAVRRQCVFTTHTPVSAGHDRFRGDLVRRVLGEERVRLIESADCWEGGSLNMTTLALSLARYANGVSARHQQVCQSLFPDYPVHAITNGVHAATWTSEPFQRLYDRRLPGWRENNTLLGQARGIALAEVREAHREAKLGLLREVEMRTGLALDPGVLTMGFARRATAYKRAHLLFSDLERLRRIAREAGRLQVIYSGKAHPSDETGKALIRRVFQAALETAGDIPVVYLEDYDLDLAGLICSGVDLWLNTPEPPHEASGTSGMKAALNGVPSFSVLDGWWVEGHVEGVTGWSIGAPGDDAVGQATESKMPDLPEDAASLYDKLERVILPLYYRDPTGWAEVMRSSISLNGSLFTAQRMLAQYVAHAYRTERGR